MKFDELALKFAKMPTIKNRNTLESYVDNLVELENLLNSEKNVYLLATINLIQPRKGLQKVRKTSAPLKDLPDVDGDALCRACRGGRRQECSGQPNAWLASRYAQAKTVPILPLVQLSTTASKLALSEGRSVRFRLRPALANARL